MEAWIIEELKRLEEERQRRREEERPQLEIPKPSEPEEQTPEEEQITMLQILLAMQAQSCQHEDMHTMRIYIQ